MNEIALLERKIINKYPVLQAKIETGKRIPLRSDTMFSCMLCNTDRKQFLELIIKEAFKEADLGEIESIEYIKNKLNQDMYIEKGQNVDLIVKTKDGKYIIVELNNNKEYGLYMLNRNLSYAFNVRCTNEMRGDKKLTNKEYIDFPVANSVVLMNLNNFSFEGDDRTLIKNMIRDENASPYINDFAILDINIPNILKKWYTKEELTRLETFLYVSNIDEDELDKSVYEGDKVMEEYLKEADKASSDAKIIGLYNLEELKREQLLACKKNGYNEGIEDGLRQGIEQGSLEKSKEIAKSMLNDGLSIDKIMKYTNLSKNEIENL